MARSFESASTRYMTNATALSSFISNSAGSFSCWYKPTGTAASSPFHILLPGLFCDTGGWLGLFRGDVGGQDRIWAYNDDGAGDAVGVTYTNDVWEHFGWMHTGGQLHVMKAGVSAGNTASGNTFDLTGTLVSMAEGSGTTTDDAAIAEMAFWSVALDTAEWAALGKGFSPAMIRPASLTAYWPVLGRYSPEIAINNSARNLTLVNSPTAADHPRILYPARTFSMATPVSADAVPTCWAQYRRRRTA